MYKRQALLNFNSPIAIRYPRGQAYDGLEAVSYTHLDVYKRQL